MRRLLPILCFLPISLSAQDPNLTTLKTQARIVVVDVVVTGKDSVPLGGLKQSEFSVLDNGKPQTIKSFEEHTRLSATAVQGLPQQPVLPPGFYTNYSAAPPDTALNVLLLDALNTPQADRLFFNQQVQHFLDHVRPGTQVAIFGLTTHLTMLQGFTSDIVALRAAINGSAQQQSPLLPTVATGQVQQSQSDYLAEQGFSADLVASVQKLEKDQAAFALRDRISLTLAQLNALAKYLGGLPGRKNLVWATSGFPLVITPSATLDQTAAFRNVETFDIPFNETAQLLSNSQVAVYPIDTRGLLTSTNASVANDSVSSSSNSAAYNAVETGDFTRRSEEHNTLNLMAQATGGEAFYNTNGFAQSVNKAIDEGSHYYTLAFTPTEPGRKDRFRKLEVHFSQPGYVVSYRRGYYPDAPDAAAGNATPEQQVATKSLQLAMGFGTPSVQEIVYRLRVAPSASAPEPAPPAQVEVNGPDFLPSRPPYKRYTVEFTVLPNDIKFKRATDRSIQANLTFITLAYLPDGRLVSRIRTPVHIVLDDAGYLAASKAGYAYRQQIAVPTSGAAYLRTAVQDAANGKVGSVEVQFAAVRKLPPDPR